MGCLVAEDREHRERSTHQERRNHPGEWVMEPQRHHNDSHRLNPHANDVEDVPNAVRAVEIGAELAERPTVCSELTRGEHGGEVGGSGDERT